MFRPLCQFCNQRPRAINYYYNNVPHYRSRCTICIRKNKKIKPPEPRWSLSGYQKKLVCDLCSFRARYSAQILVYHIDGNLNNSASRNLKSICLNCSVTMKFKDSIWQRGDLEPDN